MTSDPWLDRWIHLVCERAGASPILELGCGEGRDTTVFVAAGLRVVAIDVSQEAVEVARHQIPSAEFHCQDIRDPFPPDARELGVAVASLSLHYFDWPDLTTTVKRIYEALRPGGLFLCRVNSTKDHNHGASGHPEISKNFYLVDGQTKRFFDRASIDRLFREGWRVHAVEEMEIHRWELPKVVWEVVAEKVGSRKVNDKPVIR